MNCLSTSETYKYFNLFLSRYLDESILDLIDEDYALTFLNEYSRINGLSFPSFQYKETKYEKVAELRGYKDLINKLGNTIPVTYHIKVHIKGTTFFVTYVGAPSKVFPTFEISRFWESMQLKDGTPVNLQISSLDANNGWTEENLAKLRTIYVNAVNEGVVPGKIGNREAFCDCAIDKTKSTIKWADFNSDRKSSTQIILSIWEKCEKEQSKK